MPSVKRFSGGVQWQEFTKKHTQTDRKTELVAPDNEWTTYTVTQKKFPPLNSL